MIWSWWDMASISGGKDKVLLKGAFAVSGIMSTLVIYGLLQVCLHLNVSTAQLPLLLSYHSHTYYNLPLIKYTITSFPLQEKIMRVPYGPHQEFFIYSLFLVFCNRIMTSAVSAAFLLVNTHSLFYSSFTNLEPILWYLLTVISRQVKTTWTPLHHYISIVLYPYLIY